MHTKNIIDSLKRQPFRAFEIVMSSGDRYPVRHPENAMPLKEGLFVAYHDETPVDDYPDRYTICSYLHITALEPLKAKSNGRRAR